MELSSLKALYQLVVHCCELLSLWKLLCEYQLHLTAKELTNVREKREMGKRKEIFFKHFFCSLYHRIRKHS